MPPLLKLPDYVLAKELRGGTAYYFNVPSWARKRDAEERAKGKEGKPCPVVNERLPDDHSRMIERAKELNETLDAWRRGDDQGAMRKGSFAWLVTWFENHPKFLETARKTRSGYSDGLRIIAEHELDGRIGKVGNMLARAIEPYHADAIYERLKANGRNGARVATANAAMKAARRMFNLAQRKRLVEINPFSKMDLPTTGGNTRPVERAEVERFIAKADALGYPSVGTGIMLAYELCQRENDVIGTTETDGRVTGITWTNYRAGTEIQIRQHKTGTLVWVPLVDRDGELFPGLIARLDATPRRGTLIVLRDRSDESGIHRPYTARLYAKHVRLIARAAELPADFTARACRHGGLTELGDAQATDQELMAAGGHKTRAMLSVYTRPSRQQALNAARKRRALRTQGGNLSER